MNLADKLVVRIFTLLILSMIFLAGCGITGQVTDKNIGKAGEPAKTNSYQPAAIQNYHRMLNFTAVPLRVVSLNLHTTEILLTLGLEDYLVGTAYNNAEVLPELQEKFAKIPILAEKYPSLEVLLNLNPDFVYGRESAFGTNGVAAVDNFAEYGIQAYVAKGTYVTGATMEDVYEDILNLGRIFNIEAKAIELVTQMQNKIGEIQKTVGEVERPIRVLVYDMGGDTIFTAGQSLQTTLISMAGGKNIFEDIVSNWARVSWEEVIERDPEVIVINNYGNTTAEEKINEILSHPAMQNITAVKNQRFVILPLPSVFEGVRNVNALEMLAKGFYPEKF